MQVSSFYNFYHKISDNKYIVYNSASGAILSVSLDEYKAIKNSEINLLDSDKISLLVKNGIVVDSNFDEYNSLIMKRNHYVYGEKKNFVCVIAPTTSCNAKCTYCYEKKLVPITMTEAIINNTINFIIANMEHCSEVNIIWFGGEPLLCTDIISKISRNLIEFSNNNSLKYSSFMYTNSSLIQENTIYLLKQWKINHLQICLDGCDKVHDLRKHYIDDNYSYLKLLNNIKKMTEQGIKVTLRLNIDRENATSIIDAIADIASIIGVSPNLEIIPSLLNYDDTSSLNLNEKEIKLVFYRIIDELCKYNLIWGIGSLSPKNNNCYATLPNSVVIGPSGNLFKCQQLLEDGSAYIGDVWNGIQLNKTYYDWCSTEIQDNCKNCKYLPICYGGCTAHKKDIKKQNSICIIQKYYLEILLEAIDKYKIPIK